MAKQVIMSFNEDGTMQTIYNEEMDIAEFGVPHITRASHVEPTEDGKWIADMSPIGGPILGPFDKRSIALEEEVKWIEANVFGVKKDMEIN